MNVGKTLALLATLATFWGVTYMHDRAHRYDIVAAGAGSGGSGGSQENTGDTGSTEIHAYLLDHKTGRVWVVHVLEEVPTVRRSCQSMGWTETESGCEFVKK
jgi:hypothetical protein